jgi:hypothetical protein
VPCNLFLGRTSLFPAPPTSPYILPSCLLQPSYYVKYVITVSKKVYWGLKDGYTLSNTPLTNINVVLRHTKISTTKNHIQSAFLLKSQRFILRLKVGEGIPALFKIFTATEIIFLIKIARGLFYNSIESQNF